MLTNRRLGQIDRIVAKLPYLFLGIPVLIVIHILWRVLSKL